MRSFVDPRVLLLVLLGLLSLSAASGCSHVEGAASSEAGAEAGPGELLLEITDAATGHPTPARVEIRDANGVDYVASDALRVGGDCDMSDAGAGLVDLDSTLAGFSDRIVNPYTDSTQFYSEGSSSIRVPAGPVTISVFKGPEYRVARQTVEVEAGGPTRVGVALERWVDMSKAGWYSADDHLHIPRPTPELDAPISRMMQAEDIHVANLLQMGKVRNTSIAKQHAHGPEGHYQEGHYILAAGQENPRSHFLGHTITLGAEKLHHEPDTYLIYRLLWEKTREEGALNGFAHAYGPSGSLLSPHDGMAVVAPHDLLDFVEVLQFNRSGYEAWYDLLALGFRVTPTAGTDFPCADQSIPGHERFYTKVDGPLTYARWLDAVRRGRTFVTTGPVIELRVDGQEMGGEIALTEDRPLEISGAVRFDPAADDVVFVELLQNGDVIERFSRVGDAPEIRFSVTRRVGETSWFALRGYGRRLLENTFARPLHFMSFEPTTSFHSAPIYVTLEGEPGLAQGDRAKRVARTWLARLEDLETVLSEPNAESLARRLELPDDIDGVPAETLARSRPALLEEIRVAKEFFGALAR